MSDQKQRPPRDLRVEPLGPGEFPIPGDWDYSYLRSETIPTDGPQNGKWGIFHWTWPDDTRPFPSPEITYD